MASLPPTSLPPVAPVQAGAPAPPTIVPAQVVTAELTSQLVRILTLPVTAAQLPLVTQPAPAAPAPILQLQTPQGTVQIALPPPPATSPSGSQQQQALSQLTPPQWQQLVQRLIDTGRVQLQLAPAPAALLQRLPPGGINGTVPILAQLILPARDLQSLLNSGAPQPPPAAIAAQPTPLPISVIAPPSSVTATILPAALATTYLQQEPAAPFATKTPAQPPAGPAAPTPLQQFATSIRSWFNPTAPTSAGSSPAAPRVPVSQQPSATVTDKIRVDPTLQIPASPLSAATGRSGPQAIVIDTDPGAATELPDSVAHAHTPQIQAGPTANIKLSAPLQQVTLTLLGTTASAQATASVASNPANTPATSRDSIARLLGFSPAGEQILAIDSGQGSEQVLLAPATLPIAAGKPVAVRLAPLQPGPFVPPAPVAPTLEALQPALHDVLTQLAATTPALVPRLAAQTLMQPGALAPAMLFFLSALQISPGTPQKASPSLTATLRTALDQLDLKAERPVALAERLLGELRQLGTGRAVTDELGQLWRGYSLPTLTGEALQTPLMLYLQPPLPRREGQPDQQGAPSTRVAERQTRFVVDMQLSKLGLTQLEGLSRARQLDLTLRTHAPLPSALQAELIGRYTEIASATGLTGVLQFGGRWFHPRDADMAELNTGA